MATPWKGERADLNTLGIGWRTWANGGAPDRRQPFSPVPTVARPNGHSKLDFGQYIAAELGWGSGLSWESRRGRAEHVINFLKVPVQLEPFLTFGHAACIDLFLFNFTYLPFRCMVALGTLFLSGFSRNQRHMPAFTRAHAYDLVRGCLILISVWALGAVQVSRVYHYIRGEAIIKLYVLFNILEIFDKLASGLGQDVLDALYRTLRDHLGHQAGKSSVGGILSFAFHFLIGVLYVVAHSLILFVQIVCLNVAINSKNNALLTLLISNNFVELKGSVFKRFEAENLFQVSCADVVERFQMSLFLGLIALQEFSSTNMIMALLPSIVAIYLCEVLVDYLKHSFISKFNRLHSDLYSTFASIISYDIIKTRGRMETSLDPTHICVKRLGLPTIPLSVVVCRIILLKVAPHCFPRLSTSNFVGIAVYVAAAACLFGLKSLLGMYLTVKAATRLHKASKAKSMHA